MGIWKRFWNWLRSLFGGKKKETQDFESYVRKMQEGLRNMKAQTEAVLAAQQQREREIARLEAEIAKMGRYAAKAKAETNEKDARFFTEKKAGLERQLAELVKQKELAAGYTAQAEKLYQQAEAELAEITARKDAIKAKLAAAELMESMNRLEESRTSQELREKAAEAQAAMDKAEALAELEQRTAGGDLEALMRKYDEAEEYTGGQQYGII